MTRFFDPFRDFREFDLFRRDFDRLFDTWRTASPWRQGFLPGREPRSYPLVNMWEDSDNVYVEALAPGLDPDAVELSVMRNQLTISGEKKSTNGKIAPEHYHRTERAGGKFIRTFTLPGEVDDKKVQAQYKSGLLRVILPKAEVAKPRQIEVSVS